MLQVHPADMVEHDVGVEALRMPAHAIHELRTLQVLDVARPVIDIGRGHELAALLEPGDQQRLAVGPRRVDRGGISGGPGAQDD